jgi:peptidyl-tRNA hydrolase, PTH2 family
MDACMYIIANPTLGMTPGKLAAQVAHAAVEAFRLTALHVDGQIIRVWYSGGHYKKIVLQADDLQLAFMYLTERGIRAVPIIDEGHTEFDGKLTLTAIGVPLVDKDDPHIRDTFSTFKLYKERPQQPAQAVFEGNAQRCFEPVPEGELWRRPGPEPAGLFGRLRSWFD